MEDLERLQTIGTGTFGRVFLVKHKPTGEYYALKCLKKSEIVRLEQISHTISEKKILTILRHPFIVSMKHSFQDNAYVYMLLEYVVGGELFSYLRKRGRFPIETARFFAAQITLALEYIHARDIAYRDLKPENVLIDHEGNVRLTDFGFAKKIDNRTFTLCGTPEYIAPEIILGTGHGKGVDWWALGILIFEMLAGYPPFYENEESPDKFNIYKSIIAGAVTFPDHFEPQAKDLIKRLLATNVSRRLGVLKGGAEDVKKHSFFEGIDWNEVYNKRLIPPIIPEVEFEGDASNFDNYDNDEDSVHYADIGKHNEGPDPFESHFKDF
jgi:protein kinase X